MSEVRSRRAEPALLSGGNPEKLNGDSDAVVSAYIAAIPG